MRTAEPSPPGEERGIEIGRGSGGGGRRSQAPRARTHTHTSARASHCHSNTRRCAVHTQAHAHTLSQKHTPAGGDARATHSPEALPDSLTQSCAPRPTEMPTHGAHPGVKNTQTRQSTHAHLDAQGLRQTKTIEGGSEYRMVTRPTDTQQGHTHQHMHTSHIWGTDTHTTHQRHRHPRLPGAQRDPLAQAQISTHR